MLRLVSIAALLLASCAHDVDGLQNPADAGGGLDADAGDAEVEDAGTDTAPPDGDPPRDGEADAIDAGRGDCACAADLSAGRDHTCVLTDEGRLLCWGRNDFGQAIPSSRGVNVVEPMEPVPDEIFLDVSAGGNHTCAVTDGGAVRCWGDNHHMELGHMDTEMEFFGPVDVPTIASASEVDVGYWHSCARVDASLRCWGQNQSGELGADLPTPPLTHAMPQVVMDVVLDSPTRRLFSAGDGPNAAITGGTVVTWGYGGYGAIGDGAMESRIAPVEILSGADFVMTSAGGTPERPGDSDDSDHGGQVCVATRSAVSCWGRNQDGQVSTALGSTVTTPQSVLAVPVADLSAGGRHTCVVTTSSGDVVCWGRNDDGQLGLGSMGGTLPPNPDNVSLRGARMVDAGGEHTCAIDDAERVYCWGRNDLAQIDGSGTSVDTPQLVAIPIL